MKKSHEIEENAQELYEKLRSELEEKGLTIGFVRYSKKSPFNKSWIELPAAIQESFRQLAKE